MHVKSLISALALTAALAVSGPAFSQTMFNGAELSEADLPGVTERCEQLVNAESTEPLSTETDGTDGKTDDANDGAENATIEDAPAVNEVENATSTIDLDSITLEQCTEAGLPAPAN